VSRRCWTTWVAPLTAVVLLAPAPARAAGVATFRLTNDDPVGVAPVTEVVARVLPPGSIVPRDVDKDPPTILDPSSGYVSSGFNPDDLQVVLGDGTTATGEPFQALKLDFGPGGFSPGGRLYFQLNMSPAFQDMVRLVLPTSIENLAIESISVSDAAPTPTPAPPPQVPEPMSVLVWSILTGAGVWRARAFRRLRAAPLAG
jgi:hypothetical protein